MTVKSVYSIAAALTFALGTAWLLAPAFMLAQWGLAGDAPTAYMSRRLGGMFFGYAAILWLARHAEASPARHAISAGGLVVTAVMAGVSLFGVLAGTIGPAAWSAVVIEVALAAAFASLLLAETRSPSTSR
jgi:hypothetical protein